MPPLRDDGTQLCIRPRVPAARGPARAAIRPGRTSSAHAAKPRQMAFTNSGLLRAASGPPLVPAPRGPGGRWPDRRRASRSGEGLQREGVQGPADGGLRGTLQAPRPCPSPKPQGPGCPQIYTLRKAEPGAGSKSSTLVCSAATEAVSERSKANGDFTLKRPQPSAVLTTPRPQSLF